MAKQQSKTRARSLETDASGNTFVPDPSAPGRFVLVAAGDEPPDALRRYLGLPVEGEEEE